MRVEPQIIAEYVADGRVSLAFVHVLDHGQMSVRTHLAAECAGAQEPLGFWHMHDLLFERQRDLWKADAVLLGQWAEEIGLDGAMMQSCLADPATLETVNRIDQARRDAGIRIRPTFDLNGQLIPGATQYKVFAELFDQILTN